MIFDLDGTLVDSHGAIVEAFRRAAVDRGHAAPPAPEVARRIGLPLDRMFEELLAADAGERQALFLAYREHFWALEAHGSGPFPGVAGLLDDLCGAGVTCTIASSKMRAGIERVLARTGLRSRFALCLGVDDVTRPKPHPEMVLATLDALRAQPEDAVVVGDTEFDLRMARDAGVAGIGVAWGAHDAERLAAFGPVARSVGELADLLGAATAWQASGRVSAAHPPRGAEPAPRPRAAAAGPARRRGPRAAATPR